MQIFSYIHISSDKSVKQFDNLNLLNKISNNVPFTFFFFFKDQNEPISNFSARKDLCMIHLSVESFQKRMHDSRKANKHIVWHIMF